MVTHRSSSALGHTGRSIPARTLNVPVRNVPAIAFDSAIAAVLVAFGFLQLAAEGLGWLGAAGMLAMTVPVATRRLAPLTSLAVGWGALFASEGLGADITSRGYAAVIALIITVYTVAAHSNRARAAVGLAVAIACVWASIPFTSDAGAPSYAFTALIAVAPWAAGRVIRDRQLRIEELRALSTALQAEREAGAQAAVLAERDRMAREMHDVLAHTVSVMAVQLGGVASIIDTNPAQAKEVVVGVRALAKSALAELRFMLGLEYPGLGSAGQAPPVPSPGLARLDALADDMRRVGLAVDMTVSGSTAGLLPATDLAAYRIVQEALTNALRHSAGGPARVRIHIAGDVRLEILSALAAAPADRVPGGHGIAGMRERARLCGGEFSAGPDDAGCFRVHAILPLAVVP